MDEIKKDQLKPYVVLGTGSLNKMEKSFDKLAKQNSKFYNQLDNVEDDAEKIRQKFEQLTSLKQVSEKSGRALGSQEVKGLMETIGSTVTTLTQDIEKTIIKSMGPVDIQLKQTLDLLASPNEDAQDEALDRIEDLQKAFGTDFDKIAEAMGANTKDLIAARRFQKEQNDKKSQLQDRIVQERIQVRDELRERGINTILDKKTNTLKVQTLQQEKQTKQQIYKDEEKLIQQTKENNRVIKELRSKETFDKGDEQKILNLKTKEEATRKDLEKRKEEANIQPKQKMDGFFAQTFGAAIDAAKNTFGELKDMGGSLLKGFKNLPGAIGGFAKGLGRAAMSLGIFILKGLLIGVVIGVVIYAIYKLYQAFKKAKDFVSNLFSFSKKKNDPNDPNVKDPLSDTSGGASDSMGEARGDTYNDNRSSTASSTAGNIKNTTSIENEATDANKQAALGEAFQQKFPNIKPLPRQPINVNKMSSDMAAEKESKANNLVVAPQTSSNVTNNNTTQSISMLPTNPDRSFINLNSVPI